jgi:arylsulfatase
MTENVFIVVKNTSHTITAQVTVPEGGANGVILCQAGRFGGWSLYLKDGKPAYTYNFLGLQQFTITADKAISAGNATIRMEFAYDGGGMGKGGTATLMVDGSKVAEGRIEHTQGVMFSADEGADVGQDGETPVANDYGITAPYRFTGKIRKVTVDIKPMEKAQTAQAREALAVAAHKKVMSD